MTVVEMKNKLHQQIDLGDERLLKMIYAFVNEYKNEESDIEAERKKLVMQERERYFEGIGKSYSWDEVKEMAITGKRP